MLYFSQLQDLELCYDVLANGYDRRQVHIDLFYLHGPGGGAAAGPALWHRPGPALLAGAGGGPAGQHAARALHHRLYSADLRLAAGPLGGAGRVHLPAGGESPCERGDRAAHRALGAADLRGDPAARDSRPRRPSLWACASRLRSCLPAPTRSSISYKTNGLPLRREADIFYDSGGKTSGRALYMWAAHWLQLCSPCMST